MSVANPKVNRKGYKHFEKELAVECILKFELRDRTVSCFVLKQGNSSLESLQFVFGWESKGIHTTLSAEQETSMFDAIQSGLKDIHDGEKLTVHFGSVSSDRDRQQQLQELYEQADTPQLKFLVMGDKQRVQELSKAGLRKPKFLRLYATYTLRGVRKVMMCWKKHWLGYRSYRTMSSSTLLCFPCDT